MKIVQSYWSKPSEGSRSRFHQDRSAGGWREQRHHYMSWAYSCLQLRKYYSKVELVTDQYGKELLIDRLQLPYTSVRVELDQLNHYDKHLWTLGKLHAYRIQEEPFLHVDSDVFIWERFRPELEQASIVAQNIELNHQYYEKVLAIVKQGFYIPDAVRASLEQDYSIVVSNTGIVGGNDLSFFQYYPKLAFEWVDRNLDRLQEVDIGAFSVTVEQYLFYHLSHTRQIPVTYYFDRALDYSEDPVLINFYSAPVISKFIHPIAGYKKEASIFEQLEVRLRQDYPAYYFHLHHLLNQVVL